MSFARGPFGLSLGFLVAALLATFAQVQSQERPREVPSPPGIPLGGLLRPANPASQKGLAERRLQIARLGWWEFWEREEELWRRIEARMKESEKIAKRLLSLEKKKEEILERLRKFSRKKRPLSERTNDLMALRNLAQSTAPLAARRVKSSSEMKALQDEWMLFQEVAPEIVRKESERHQQKVAASIVDDFIEAFRKGDVKAISKILFRGAQVNKGLGQQAYLRHLEDYFRRVRVSSFQVKDRAFREGNPFTLRVRGNYALEEVEILKGGERKPRRRERNGPISFTLREISGRWLISAMKFPD
ncbi:MAG: hypothetical protein ACE5JS_18980 [Nitrospinota bacterium]